MKINQHILALLAAVAVVPLLNATPANAQSRPSVYTPGITLAALSDNGTYAIGRAQGDQEVDNPHGAGGTLVDLSTKTRIDIDAPGNWAEVNDVADNGIVVGSALGRPGYWSPETHQWTTFGVPPVWGGGCFNAVTPDAKYAVGYYSDANDPFAVSPMMYDLSTGQRVELPNLPTHDLTGKDRRQNLLYGVSPDGRYVLGQISQSYLGEYDEILGYMVPALFSYVYDRNDDTWRAIGYDYDAASKRFTPQYPELHYVNSQYMSADGAWVTGSVYLVRNGGEASGGTEGFYTFRYEVATDEFIVYDDTADTNVVGNKVAPDGTVLACSPYGNPYPTAQIRYGKYFISLDQIIEQVYGTTVNDLVHDAVTGSFEALSADGLTAIMITYDNCYVITMPESFSSAASKVDLLKNFTVNIPDGSTVNRISEIQITFERPIDCLTTPQSIRLLDSNGNTVRSASGISVSRTNDHTIVVTFRSTALTPGETYTVDIPAEMIWVKNDTSIKANAIQIHYVGRAEGPVQMQSVLPSDGSTIAQLNSSPDYITLTFDTQVAISQNAQCGLYNADDDSFITSLMATTEGRRVYLFPLATYQLYKGTNYKVVVAPGSVTDLSGGGGNEEIVLNYVGSYVRELSADDIYIYNNPCDNYDKFIFWKDETNQPSAIPQSWGFTSDNIWLLVRDNEQSDDWALAAHSMFTPAGESNSWLITPQLFIPDANSYLAFDAQSYLRTRDDNLKVYVYESDAVYNYFSDKLAEDFKTDGDLVFDEIVPAGETDEGLEGEWMHYTVTLEKYAGKNIYIAFVYNNFDKSAIFIDDVKVVRNMNFLFTNQTPTTVVGAEQVTVSGLVSVASEIDTYEGISLRLIDEDGDIVDEIIDQNATLKYGDTYKFSFANPLPLTPGYESAYTVELTSGEESMSYNFEVKDLIFEPVKRVVLEEFSGSACSNCPLGILAVENLLNLYPDNFIPVVLRTYTNDIYATGVTEYTSFLGFNAAPSGRINRGPIIAPMLQNGSAGYTYFGRGIVMSDGTEAYLWADAVQDELNEPTEMEVTFTSSYDQATGQITVPCNVRFALNRTGKNIGVYAVVVEDYLPTYQLNGFAGVQDPTLGPWGLGGMYGQATVTSWQVSDVARFVVNGRAYSGTSLIGSDFEAGADYGITLSSTIPDQRLSNPENCRVVVMVIDRSTGRIVNAAQSKLTLAGIEDVATDVDAPIEYYDLQGVKVQAPAPGHIYIKVQGGKATKVKI